MQKPINILHLEDNLLDAELVQARLDAAGILCKITRVQTSQEFSGALQMGGFDLILADFNLPAYDGMSAMRFVMKHYPDTPFIFISGIMGEDSAIQALTEGATDYVLKQKLSRIVPAVRRAMQEAENRAERRRSESALRESEQRYRDIFEESFDGLFITSPAGKFLDMNKKGILMFGYATKEEISSLNLERDIYAYPADRKRILGMLQTQGSAEYEIIVKKKSGELMVTLCSLTPVKDEQGKVTTYRGIIRDITERKRVEAELKRRQILFQALFDRSPDAVVVIDPHDPNLSWPIIDCNATTCLMNGYSREELIGHSIDILNVTPGTQAERIAYLERLRDAGNLKVETHHRRKNGIVFPIEVTTSLVAVGERELIIGIDRDITERRQAETALRESEQRFQLASWATKDVIWERNFSTNTISWNNSLLKLFHYSADEIEPTVDWWQDHIHPDERIKVIKSIQAALEQGENFWSKEYRFRRVDGSYANIFDRGYILYNEQGKPLKMIGAMMDITERIEMEANLAKQKYLMDALLDTIPDYIYFKDIKSQFIRTSKAHAKAFGLSDPAQVIGKTDFDFFTDEHARQAYEDEQEIIRTGQSFSKEEKETWPDRPDTWVIATKMPLRDQKGKIIGTFGISKDITNRKQAEERLEVERNLLNTLIDILPDSIFIKDVNSRIVVDNIEHRLRLGATTLEEVVGKTDFDFFPNELAAPYFADEEKIIQSGEALINQVEPFFYKDRKQRWLLTTKVPLRDRQGTITGIVGISHDITERKQAEDALKKERAHLEKRTAELDAALRETEELFSTVQAILTSTNLMQVCQNLMEHFINLVKADRITLYLVDHERQEILLNLASGSSQGVLPMTYQELNAGIAGQVFKSGQPVLSLSADDGLEPPEICERRVRDNVGSLIVVPLLSRDSAGTLCVIGVVTVLNRVGQRAFTQHEMDLLMMMAIQAAIAVENIRLYEETRQRVTELELLYESGLAISQLLNPKEIGQKLIDLLKQKMNWHHTAIRRYNAEDKTLELLAFHQPNIKSETERLALETHFKTTVSRSDQGLSGWVIQHGETVRTGNVINDNRYIETFAGLHSGLYVPIKTGKRVIGVIAIESEKENAFSKSDEQLATILATQAASIFENARLYQEAEKARDAANAANRSKSDFLANMSHEIRTPMNAIIGLTQLVLDTNLEAAQRNYLQKVQASSRALLGILNDILDYSKIEAGKLDLEEVDFDLGETLRNTAELFSFGAEEKGIELVFEITSEVPLALNGDPLRLGQVLNNLVGNAVKFTEQGEIHVKVEMEKIEDGKIWLQFSVRDTGIGITEKQIERLFHAFSQADTSTTRKFGGTGLGLTISKRLVDMMGGEIGVESVQGQGSVFHFTVPLQPARSNLPLRQTGELRGMKTLVVDDQDTSLRVMDNLLNSWSFDVTLTASGEKALDTIMKAAQSGHPFELLLIDWKMPGMDGLELAQRIRDLGPQIGRPPLVIMVTAFSREDVLRSAEEIQLDAVLEKPVTPSRLFDLLVDLQEGTTPSFQTVSQTDNLELFERTRPIHGAQILVVEDNATNQLVARGFLEKMALVVDIASDGQEAVNKITSQDYDLILMDLQMPKMDGFEATRQIRSMERGSNLPIIAMTASVMQKDKDASDAAGMNGHIAKPISVDELVSVLLTWIPRHPDVADNAHHSKGSSAHSDYAIPDATPDFDLNITLGWLGGDRTLLKQILTSFQADLARISQEVRAASEQGNWTVIKGITHKLKGTAGNVGAVALQRQAVQLETELMEQPNNVDVSALEEKIKQALELCKRFLTELADDQVEKSSTSRDEVDQALDELATLLLHNRLIPVKLLETVQAARTWGASSESLEKLGQEADTFNYKEALLTLETIRKELESNQ